MSIRWSRLETFRPRPLQRWQKLLAGLLLVTLAATAVLLWPYKGYEGQKFLLIEQGMSRQEIARRLAEEGVVVSRWPFLFYAALRANRTLKAGEYLFTRPLSVTEVFVKLAEGQVRLYSVLIPPGYNRWDIADRIAGRKLADREAFLEATENTRLIRDLAPEAETLEGYLFPDTYHFARPSDPDVIVETMVEHFRRTWRELVAEGENPYEFSTHELMTLASLVEKETGVPEERGLIASVFYNRLKRRRTLQADPTVIYAALLENEGEFDNVIHRSDLRRDHPYNTYTNKGLPPGPITSPSRASLEAVLNPPDTNYLYFVSNTEGGHFFARTGAEHARNVARYRRLRAEKRRKRRAEAAERRAAETTEDDRKTAEAKAE